MDSDGIRLTYPSRVQAFRSGQGVFDHQLLRLRVLGTSDSGLEGPLLSTADRLWLLQDGCPLRGPAMPAAGDWPLAVAGWRRANGYQFAVAGGDGDDDMSGGDETGGDSARLALEASDDVGKTWLPVGGCSWVTVLGSADNGSTWATLGPQSSWLVDCSDGGVDLHSVLAGRNSWRHFRVDFRQDSVYQWLSMGFVIAPLGWSCALFAALTGRARLFKPIVVTTLGVWGLWCMCWQVLAEVQSVSRLRSNYLLLAFCGLPALWSSLAFHVLERHLVLLFFLDGAFFLAHLVGLWATVYGRGLSTALTTDAHAAMLLLLSAYLLLGSVLFYWFRRRALLRARLLVMDDQRRYDAFWAETLRTQEAECIELSRRARALSHKLLTVAPQQLDYGPASWAFLPRGLRCLFAERDTMQKDLNRLVGRRTSLSNPVDHDVPVMPGPPMVRRPLRSLDQLFVQATCLMPLLMDKVCKWAAGCRGLFPRAGIGGESAAEAYALYNPAAHRTFKWCGLKSAHRAIEKVIRAYGQDVSRLLDVCRQAIVFETLRDLAACLGTIADDDDVVVLRVKNRYDPAYDAEASWGYRDVNINLRFRSPTALMLGVSSHVCELQLMLRGVAALKSDEGHRNYVAGRNLRAD